MGLEALQSEMFKLIDEARFEETAPVAREIVTIEARLTEIEKNQGDKPVKSGAKEAEGRAQVAEKAHHAMAKAAWKRSAQRLKSGNKAVGKLRLQASLRDVKGDETALRASRVRWREKTQVQIAAGKDDETPVAR